ncbi:MAG: extracellular solute-binding protein [Bacillales bacterium]|nr:extracellular solute-binding protein [Bacillales bacterium]MDY5919835.1 extracellular solute-binding protein [Candidatus Enteromonas sp.]
MKRTAAALFLGTILALASCGSTENEEGQGGVYAKFDGELERGAVLRILENDTAVKQGYLKELLDGFNEKYKEYGIVAVDANMDEYSDLENDGPYGYGPDILYQANDSLMKYVYGKHITPIPVERLECYSQVDQNAWEAYRSTVGGTTYTFGVPINIQTSLMYYREDLLPEDSDKNGNGTPDMFENWSELYRYSKQIHEANPSKYGYMKSLDDFYFASGYLFSYGGYIFGKNGKDPSDIGLDKAEAYKGAKVLRQLASIMNESCIDNSITLNQYSKLAKGEYFATMTTPDVRSLFLDEMSIEYQKEGLTKEEAGKKAEENLKQIPVPKLPKSGDLNDVSGEMVSMKTMGGINGYAMSSYTQYPNAALAFIDYASSYEMVKRRHEILSIATCRADLASEGDDLSKTLFSQLSESKIEIMPSIRETAQIWTPAGTLCKDLANDPYRAAGDQKYVTDEAIRNKLAEVCKQIHEAIYALQ